MPPTRRSLPSRRQSAKTAQAAPVQIQDPSSSRSVQTLSLPRPDVPKSLTPNYVQSTSARKRKSLSEDERDRLVQEMIGIHPRTMLDDITECARVEIYNTVEAISGWATRIADGKGEEAEREVDIGLHALETLLESHIDLAFDKFTGWALRNAFDIPTDLAVVLPWHKGLDFERGEYVAALEKDLESEVENLRAKVEQARKLKRQLQLADQSLDRRLAVARQRRAEVAFVKDVVDTAGLAPLPQTAADIARTLRNLHAKLDTIDPGPPVPPAPVAAGTHAQAWELGRQAYLNWATQKLVSSTKVEGGPEQLDEIPAGQDVEALAAGLARGA